MRWLPGRFQKEYSLLSPAEQVFLNIFLRILISVRSFQKYNRLYCPIITAVFCLILAGTQFFPWLSDISLDLLFKVRGVKETSQSIVIVGVDEKSLEEIGPWPFDRQLHARLVEQLHLARGIGFDFLFHSHDVGDTRFRQAIEAGPPVGLAIAHDYAGNLLLPADSLGNAFRKGHIETILGKTGRVRRVNLWSRDGIPALALAVSGNNKREQDSAPSTPKFINFYGPEFTFLYLSYSDVLDGLIGPEFFRDRYVFVGAQALALGDAHITPFTRKQLLPGVEVQATILNNLLENSFLYQFSPATIFLIIVIAVLAVWIWPEGRESRNLLTLGFCGGAISLIAFVGFMSAIFIDPSLPLFVLFFAYMTHLVIQGIWVTRELVTEIKRLDKQLNEGTQEAYKTLPSAFSREKKVDKKSFWTGGIRNHVAVMHDGIRALTLQHHFVNHLLSEETPPLILWEKSGGDVVMANSSFSQLWQEVNEGEYHLPDLNEFLNLLVKKQLGEVTQQRLQLADLLDRSDSIVDIDLKFNGKRKYSRVLIHTVENQLSDFQGVLANFTDVTEIKELERLKGEVMNIVSHELKLPLTTILGYGEMLSATLKNEQKQYADEICSQSNRLGKMIEDFLDIARVESGKHNVNRYPLDLLTVVYDVESAIRHFAKTKEIELVVDVPQMVSPVMGDEPLLTQAVLNLLDNAIKFSPEKSRVSLTLTETEKYLSLTVADEGPGIPFEERKSIFDKFSRGKQQSKEKGFGLGLSFVQQVIDGHGGKVKVGETAGGGAEFTLILNK